MVNHLKPLLEQYQANYICGHEHCAEVIVENNVNYYVNGLGHGCCYRIQTSYDNVANPSNVKYILGNPDYSVEIDDDGFEKGINGTIGGFSSVVASSSSLTVTYYNQNGQILFVAPKVFPRKKISGVVDNSNDFDFDIESQHPLTLFEYIMVYSICISAILLVCCLYYYNLKTVNISDSDSNISSNSTHNLLREHSFEMSPIHDDFEIDETNVQENEEQIIIL